MWQRWQINQNLRDRYRAGIHFSTSTQEVYRTLLGPGWILRHSTDWSVRQWTWRHYWAWECLSSEYLRIPYHMYSRSHPAPRSIPSPSSTKWLKRVRRIHRCSPKLRDCKALSVVLTGQSRTRGSLARNISYSDCMDMADCQEAHFHPSRPKLHKHSGTTHTSERSSLWNDSLAGGHN